MQRVYEIIKENIVAMAMLLLKYMHIYVVYFINQTNQILNILTCVTNLGGNMARFTQFPLMITRSTIIYEIISPGAAGSSIYV